MTMPPTQYLLTLIYLERIDRLGSFIHDWFNNNRTRFQFLKPGSRSFTKLKTNLLYLRSVNVWVYCMQMQIPSNADVAVVVRENVINMPLRIFE